MPRCSEASASVSPAVSSTLILPESSGGGAKMIAVSSIGPSNTVRLTMKLVEPHW